MKDDYAKWMLEDPKVNFAIPMRLHASGVNHLGIQVDTDAELQTLRDRLETADTQMVEERDQPCCHARSDKYWVTDPAGIAWQSFHTLESIPVYGDDTAATGAKQTATCCVPEKPTPKASSCCAP